MENPNHKWRFIAGKIIYFYGPSIPWLCYITRGYFKRMGVFKHSEEIWAQESHVWSQRGIGKRPPDPLPKRFFPCIIRQNNHRTCSSFPKPWHIMTYLYHFPIQSDDLKKNLKQRFFPSKNCHSLLRKFTVGGPIAAQVLANWCAHKGYPRLKDEEEVRRRRKLARRGRFGKLRNNESWHGKRSSPESENLEMYSFIMF